MNGLLVVVGATGLQGSSVVDEALKCNIAVRGVTRDATSKAAHLLRHKGVEMVEANLDDQASLVAAFKDASAIFAVTDFWSPFIEYMMAGESDAWEKAKVDEIRRGKNIVDAASETVHSLEHFLFSSLPSIDRLSNHTIPDMNHYEGKAEIVRYIEERDAASVDEKQTREGIETLGAEATNAIHPVKHLADVTTVLYCGYYMENFVRWDLNPYLIPQKDDSGSLYASTRAAPSTKLELLDTRKDLGLFAVAALKRSPLGTHGPPILAISESLNLSSVYKIIGKATGHEILYRQSAPGEMGRKYPGLGGVFEQMYNFYNEHGFAGNTKMVKREQLGIVGKPTSFEEFVVRHSWEGFLG